MVVDQGAAGIDQSRHHPHHGAAQYASEPRGSGENAEDEQKVWLADLKGRIEGWICPGKIEEVMGEMARAARQLLTRRVRDAPKVELSAEVTTAIQTTIEKALHSSAKAAQAPQKSWAAVAARSVAAGEQQSVQKVVPARQARELIVRPKEGGWEPEIQGRSPEQTVQAVNTALGAAHAIAARRLRSGDVLLTFRSETEKAAEGPWIEKAFEQGAQLRKRVYAVVAKRLPAGELRSVQAAAFLQALKGSNRVDITKCTIRLGPPGTLWASAVVLVSSVEDAQELCSNGLIWRAQLFDCEPYAQELTVRQCFRCYSFGHIGRYCRATARCGRCAGAAHEGGDKTCPEGSKPSCINCRGDHPSWDKNCQKAQEQRRRAQAAYPYRPKQFQRGGHSGPAIPRELDTLRRTIQSSLEEDGFTIIQSKRKRIEGAAPILSQTAPPPQRGRPRTILQRPAGTATITEAFNRSSSAALTLPPAPEGSETETQNIQATKETEPPSSL